MEIAPDTAFVVGCCLFWAGVFLGALGWDFIRSHIHHHHHEATADEKAIARQMEREYRSRMKDVQRGKGV
jgi:hypothetical protein